MPSDHTFLQALGGGVLIGLATLLGAVATGVPPGISGVFSEVLKAPKGETAWRILFLAGLIAGASAAFALSESASIYRPPRALAAMATAGLLVGIGTRISNGCTSGHGICGIGLGARRGFAATLLFMGAGMATVWVLNHLATNGSP